MATFDEILNALQAGGEDLPPTIYDDLRNEYQLRVDGAAAASQIRQEEIERAQAEVTRLKAVNFDLMMSQPTNPENADGGIIGDNDPTEPQSFGIDDLFRVQ